MQGDGAAPGAAARLHVQGMPTAILFDGGRAIARRTGVMGKEAIVAFVRGRLSPDA